MSGLATSEIESFQGKVIWITGASSGIGKAVSFEMAKRGYSLALTARRLDLLESLRADIMELYPSVSVEVRSLDVTYYDAVSATLRDLAEAIGGLDILLVVFLIRITGKNT